jgi:hypothetical protein
MDAFVSASARHGPCVTPAKRDVPRRIHTVDDCPRDVREVESAVQRYLEAHPNAFDTAEGIRMWWLADLEPAPAAVQAALDHLVERGIVVEKPLPDGRSGYAAGRLLGRDRPR